MKKTLLFMFGVVLLAKSSIADGNVIVGANARTFWTIDLNTDISSLTTRLDFSIMAGPAATTPTVDSIATSTPTNGATFFDTSAAWNDILNQTGFFQIDGTNNAPLVGHSFANGGATYNASTGFASQNLTGGTTYTMYVIGWDSTYATAALAQAADAWVGWSSPFQYTPTITPNPPASMGALISPFGVQVVPEPATIALAGLGALGLFGLHRRK